MRYFPLFVDLSGRLVVVVGGGVVAERKIELLRAAGAQLRVVAPTLTPRLAAHAASGAIDYVASAFNPAQLTGARLTIAATDDPVLNRTVARAADARDILVNVVDDQAPSSCIVAGI